MEWLPWSVRDVVGAVGASQAEIDFKAECVAGDKVDCLGAVLSDADSAATNGSGAPRPLLPFGIACAHLLPHAAVPCRKASVVCRLGDM